MRFRGLSVARWLIVLSAMSAAAEPTEQTASESSLSLLNDPVEEMVVTGFRPGALPAIPGPVTHVLLTENFVAENKNLADLLSETEGISVRRLGGAGARSEVTIRGSTPAQVAVSLDGVRVNSLLTGGLNLSRVCLPLVDRVEVTSGAGTLVAGSGAIGGVVNIVTRAAASPGTRVALTAGSFETYEASLLHSGVSEDLDYRLGYCGFSTQGDFKFARPITVIDGIPIGFEPDRATRVNNDREQHAGNWALGTKLFGGSLRFSNYTVYSSGGEPGSDSANGLTAGQSTAARSRDLSNLAQLKWHRTLENAFFNDVRLMLYHRHESSNFRDPLRASPGPNEMDTRLSMPGLALAVRHQATPFGQDSQLDLRLEAANDSLRATNQSGRDRPRGGIAARQTMKLFSERIQISGGVRLDWTDGFAVEALPSIGVVFEPRPWIRLRGHLGRAYRTPHFDELFHPDEGFIRGNPDLDPEDAWNFDVGGELAFAEIGPFSNLIFRASWFERKIDESIVYVFINTATIQPINSGKAHSEGFEISASLDWTRYARLSLNYTEIDSRRNRNGARLPGQASHEAFAKVRIGPEDAWKLVVEFQNVGEILVSESDRRLLPQRNIWNASAGLDLAEISALGLSRWMDDCWLFVEGNNLTDEAVRDVLSFPQPGRHFTAGFEMHW